MTTNIYIVTEGYNEDTKIIAAFHSHTAAEEWITKEATRRHNLDDTFTDIHTLQYFTDWFHILTIPLHEEPGYLTKTQLKDIFISKYYLQPASYENLDAIANLLIQYLAPITEDHNEQ